MNESEALKIIEQALAATLLDEEKPTITETTHLTGEGILDSADSMVFPIKLEELANIKVPDTDNVTTDFFAVPYLVELLISQSKITE